MNYEFFYGDLYPNMSFNTTRTQTVPEPADQQKLVDKGEQKTHVANTTVAPEKQKSIFMSLGIIFLVIVFLGMRF